MLVHRPYGGFPQIPWTRGGRMERRTQGGGRLSPEITLQYWVGGDDLHRRARKCGRAVIQSPNLSYYLDMCYGVIPLDRAYAYVPYFPEQNRKEYDRR